MSLRRTLFTASLPLVLFLAAAPAESARQAPSAPGQVRPAPAAPARPGPAAGTVVYSTQASVEDADAVRAQLEILLNRYSPNVGRVLAIDPTLLQNAGFLEPYPELVGFLNQHPEVLRSSAFYLSRFRNDSQPPGRDEMIVRMWSNLFQACFIFLGFSVVVGSIIWLVKTAVDYRRWYRLSKVQTETHNKLLDRLGANEELMSYMNTAAGRRFLESAPIALDTTPSIGSPLKRILWAVEIGIVLACAAGGILFARSAVPEELRQPFTVVGTFVVSVGVGFILAALVSYMISDRMGVLKPAGQEAARADVTPAE